MLVLLDFPNNHGKSQDGLTKGFFAAGVPGSTYFTFPKGYAKKIPRGARLRFQMHYTPNGSATKDQSRFGIVLAKGPGLREVQTYAVAKLDINIPAGHADHFETAIQPVNGDVILTTLMPHLHVRGKSFTYTVVWPSGKKEMLLSVTAHRTSTGSPSINWPSPSSCRRVRRSLSRRIGTIRRTIRTTSCRRSMCNSASRRSTRCLSDT